MSKHENWFQLESEELLNVIVTKVKHCALTVSGSYSALFGIERPTTGTQSSEFALRVLLKKPIASTVRTDSREGFGQNRASDPAQVNSSGAWRTNASPGDRPASAIPASVVA
jgi:hypothetical protein